MRFLQAMLTSLVTTPLRIGAQQIGALGRWQFGEAEADTQSIIAAVMSATGEVSSLVYAGRCLDHLESLDDDELLVAIDHLAEAYDIDAGALATAASSYATTPDMQHLTSISQLAEPGWMELFRRLNATTGGTVRLVRLRQRMLGMRRGNANVERIDPGLTALLRMWFNPGFLMLQPIDWSTPANILEKIIAYEAVHEISSWDDLRARLAPEDRRCFAFFHPSMPEEPLIFVEVALTRDIPTGIESVLEIDRDPLSVDAATTAVFYSISNCQAGLAGISFGNFLIKRVAQELRAEFAGLKTFVTLSPVPGLMRWLRTAHPELATQFDDADSQFWETEADRLKPAFAAAALRYFTHSDRPDGWPNDPVARFHIGNGATLHHLQYGADRSAKGMAQAGGLMVNYLYDLEVVESNHETFHETKAVPLSGDLKTIQKSLKG